MKNVIKKTLAFLIAMAVSLSAICVLADGERKLYDMYELKDKFEYENEIIGHALETTVVKIENQIEISAEYQPVYFDGDEFLDGFVGLVEANPNATMEEILAYMKDEEHITEYLYFDNVKKTLTSGCMATGSGVVISEDGYIATNTHVVEFSEDDALNFMSGKIIEGIIDDIKAIIEDANEIGLAFNEQEQETLIEIVQNATMEKLTVNVGASRLYVLAATAYGDTSYDAALRWEATVVKKGTAQGKESLTEDSAIIKIPNNNMVALSLSSNYPNTNSTITSGGFPGADEAIFESYGSTESTLAVHCNIGSVTNVKSIEGTTRKAIGISSTISNGSSGGPSVDNHLDIEGLNTYSLVRDNRFAYMVPAEIVREQSYGINLIQDEATKTYMLGLQTLQEGYGLTAAKCFERVAQLQPNTPYIQELIAEAKASPQEEAPKKSLSIDPMVWVIVGVVIGVIIFIVILIVIIISISKKKKNSSYSYDNTSSYNSSYSNFGGGSSDGSLF